MSAYLEYFKERVPWARDMNDVDIVEHMSKVTGKPVRAVAEEFGIQSQYGLVPDIKRGFGQAVGGVGSTMQDMGMPDAGRAVENYGKRIVLENPSQINSFGDILDKPFVTAREAVGEVVPQAGSALVGSTVGRIAGGALGLPFGPPGVALGSTLGGFAGGMLPIAAQTYGGIRAEQREQGIDDKERAALATIPAVALERLGVEQIATRLGTKGLKNFATDQLKPGESTWGYAGRQAMKTGLVEGPFTEIPQTALERYGAYKDLTSEEALNEYGVAGVKGYVGGVAIGGAMAPFSLLPESNPGPKGDTPPPPPPRGQLGLFTPEEAPPTPGAVAPTGAPAFADAQAENAVRDLLTQRAQFATQMASAQASQNTAEFYQAQDIVGRIDEQLGQLPQGLVESVARGMQAPSGQLGLFGAQPFNQVPPAPTPSKTPFFEPPLVSTLPGGSMLPVIGPQPQIITGENPDAQLVLPQADPVQAWQEIFTKAQRGELLTQVEREILNNPPQGIQLPEAAPPGMAVRQQPTQGELFDDTPLRSAFDVATRGLPPVPQQGPVLTNNQNPNQAELFEPDGQPWAVGQAQRNGQAVMSGLVPTYAASQGVPDVAGAAAETSRAAGIPAGRPGSKAGSVRQQLLERIEKARMEGRFVGREGQYDDLVNDLTVNAFGRVEKTLAEVEKAPLLPTATEGASPLAAPGTRTLQDVDTEMDAMLVNGRAPKAGVALEAWNDLQRERNALAAQVGAPPRPKYVPPKKTATPDNASRPTAAPTPVPAPAPVPPTPPARPVVEKAPPAPKKEAPAPLKETPQEAFDAMQDEIAYKDLTPEAKGMVDGAHKEGRLSQEEIDFIVRRDKAAKRSTKPAQQEETDLDEPSSEQVNKVVQGLPKASITTLEEHYGISYGEDVAAFIDKVKEDVITAVNFGINKVDAAIRKIIKSIANGVMSVAVVFNPMALQTPADFALPQKYTYTVENRVEIRANVPAEARANMSPTAQRVYEAVATQATSTGKGFMIADKQNGMLHAFGPNGVIISQSPALYGKDVGDTMQKTGSQWNRVTPAGKYTLTVESDSTYAGGKVFSLEETRVPGEGVVAVHAVYLGDPKENRLGRLASPNAGDKRISWGCVNTSNQAFLDELLPNANVLEGGAIFVLPDTSSATEMFPTETRVETETREDRRTGAGNQTRASTKGRKDGVDDVPPTVLARTEVEIDAYNPDTGRFEKTTVPADQALDSLNEDKDTFQNFVNCLKKGKK